MDFVDVGTNGFDHVGALQYLLAGGFGCCISQGHLQFVYPVEGGIGEPVQGSPVELIVFEQLCKERHIKLFDQFGLTFGWYKRQQFLKNVLVDENKGWVVIGGCGLSGVHLPMRVPI